MVRVLDADVIPGRDIAARDLGHCMRVTDLDRELMIRLAGGLRAAVPSGLHALLLD